jgi:hypothetical protein
MNNRLQSYLKYTAGHEIFDFQNPLGFLKNVNRFGGTSYDKYK